MKLENIEERIQNLKTLIQQEEQSKTRSQNYIDDCKLTITRLESRKKTGWKGYEMVKGA